MPPTPPDPPPVAAEGAGEFRWQAFFQHATDPLFLLNRRRRLLFANRAWEACTGLRAAEMRGRPCRPRTDPADREEAVLAALAPPPEALRGAAAQVRRRLPAAVAGADWWEVSFFPLVGPDGLLGLLGKIHALSATTAPAFVLPERLMALRDRQARDFRLDDIAGETPAMQRVREQARLAAATRLPVTLLGPAGAGKRWLARAIHLAGAGRQGYFACLDCPRLPSSAVEETLFNPRSPLGTIYLREPAALPREIQARLAETMSDDGRPRVLLGFRTDPGDLVRTGRLLDALHFQGSPLTIVLPPLRDRADELPGFVAAFVQRAGRAVGRDVPRVSPEALDVLRQYAWPGNLGELYAVLRDACGRAKGEQVEVADLPYYLKTGPAPAERQLPLDALLEQAERRLIQLALRLARNNKTRAAELLAVWRPRLLRRMEQLGLAEKGAADETPPGEGG